MSNSTTNYSNTVGSRYELFVGEVWAEHAEELADWTLQHLVNRTERFGGHRSKEQIRGATQNGRRLGPRWTPKELTRAKILQHFRATAPNHVIGLHAADENNLTRFGAIDIDAHGGEDATVNERAALHWQGQAGERRIYAVPVDSDGKGGFHLLILFAAKVDAAHVHQFLKDLTSDWKSLGLPVAPEVFPKTPDVRTTPKKLGNWLRLLGKHHTSDHWSRVYAHGGWLAGREAIAHICSLQGNPAALLPAVAATAEPVPAPGGGRARLTGTDGADGTDGITCQFNHAKELEKALGADLFAQAVKLIKRYGPKKFGQRQARGFKIVQILKGIRPDWTLPERIHLAHVWYGMVKDVVRDKDKDVATQHFLRCFDSVRHPGGFDLEEAVRASRNEPVPAVVKLLGDESLTRLVRVCSHLQRKDVCKPFFLTSEQAGQVLGRTPMTGWRQLCFLERTLGLLKRVEVGTRAARGKPGRASTYWYLPLAIVDVSEVR